MKADSEKKAACTRNILNNNSGVALILAILIIGIIVTLTLSFNTSMRSEMASAANTRDNIKLEAILQSGLNFAIAILDEDPSASDGGYDSFFDTWATLDILSIYSTNLFNEGRFDISIIDESGKIQVNQLIDRNGNYNALQQNLLKRFLALEEFGIIPEEREDIVNSIKDWIDPDNESTDFGEESSYYEALETPYSCRNAPLESLEELLLIKGITKDIVYGTSETPGISDFLTIHGDGKININTADALVLKALSDQIDDDMAMDMVVYREDEDGYLDNEEDYLKNPTWYKDVPGMQDVSISQNIITTSSTYFKVQTKGFQVDMVKRSSAVVERKGDELKLLSWEAY
jgi:general secretion pathway protein K